MKSHPFYAAAIAAGLLVGTSTSVFAQATTTAPATSGAATLNADADDDGFDLGWLGLIGLLGLAGLSGRKRDHRTTTADPLERPRV